MAIPSARRSMFARPPVQLVLGIVCMASVANMQYGWTLFVDPIDAQHHWGRAAIQVAFTLFVAIETWLVPVEGYLMDHLGPRPVVIGGAILVAAAWTLNSVANSLAALYLAAAIGGIGTGAVYGTCVGNALKWFPARRGMAAGFTAAGFGAGAALTVAPIEAMISSAGYRHAFAFFGLLQAAIVWIAGWGLKAAPAPTPGAAPHRHASRHSFTPLQVLRKPVFYVLYLMFFLVAAGGLVLIANMAPIARDLEVARSRVDLLGMTLIAGTFAIKLQRLLDGIGRPFFGWVSDRIGREHTMAIAFLTGAAALFLVSKAGTDPLTFVLATGLYFGVFGEIYSLFPATAADTFGTRYATANAGMLYTAKGAGSLVVSFATALGTARGWNTVFELAMTGNLVAALLGLFVLKPMRARHLHQVHGD